MSVNNTWNALGFHFEGFSSSLYPWYASNLIIEKKSTFNCCTANVDAKNRHSARGGGTHVLTLNLDFLSPLIEENITGAFWSIILKNLHTKQHQISPRDCSGRRLASRASKGPYYGPYKVNRNGQVFSTNVPSS
ncbi:uncharacterized protein BDR25DRAFT_348528 [Lindgomyces ingoldianus]|uniref:Uncharacterized protein n=1 Tax=Lindgomyces ingoldianus TaxID=673940 RepID=A0ACB6RIU9_9PLEO|nr:uncharacterized protein BDR25DRAFT_348528 [Lindgomyces ingoldianus]KAF2478265.1 hypothetical protein BDR25DRAFT_348528 [Lindgomyces ingoldianus]